MLRGAYDRACEAARGIPGFAAEHPLATGVGCTVVALGVLVVLAPYVLGVLGFGELGPVEGKFDVFCVFFVGGGNGMWVLTLWGGCRQLGCAVDGEICRVCAEGLAVRFLAAAGHGLEVDVVGEGGWDSLRGWGGGRGCEDRMVTGQ